MACHNKFRNSHATFRIMFLESGTRLPPKRQASCQTTVCNSIQYNLYWLTKTVHKFRELISITTLDPKLPPPRHDHWVSHDLLLSSDSIKLLSKLLICICQFGWLCVAAETLCDLFDPWVRWERREKDQVGI